MDEATRASHLRMVRSLLRAYRHHGFDLIVNRATLGKMSIDELSDAELAALHQDMYRAMDCVRNDIPFEHAGLIDEGAPCAWNP